MGFRLALALASVALASCGGDRDASRSLVLEECRLPHLSSAARCGVVTVPEDRTRPGGRTIGIHVALLAANTLTPKADPFVILAGGPGQAASELAVFAARLNEIRRTRDVVLVDQRGTGRSAPLKCAPFSEDGLKEVMLETDLMPRAKACAAELARNGVDASQYTTAAFVDDLEAVRLALGVPRWNLWGGSYGSRVALEYLRRHPDRTRTVTLDGVAPPGMIITLDVWTSREAALERLFERCRTSEACRKALPDPAAALDAIGRSLGPKPREIVVADPATGEERRIPASADTVLGLLQPLLYAPETVALIPTLLARARAGDFAPLLAAVAALTGDLVLSMNIPLHYSVTCTEDVPRVGLGLREQALAGKRSARLARLTLALCDAWPRGRTPVDAAVAVGSDVPVLILSGGLDPVTPPANGAEVARSLKNAKHVVASGYGHIVSPQACAPRLIAAFVADGGFATLPDDCVKQLEASKPPALWTGLLGPSPP